MAELLQSLELDVRGRPCPIPIIEAAKAMARIAEGGVLTLVGTDPAIPADLEAWCRSTCNELLQINHLEGVVRAEVRKGRSFR